MAQRETTEKLTTGHQLIEHGDKAEIQCTGPWGQRFRAQVGAERLNNRPEDTGLVYSRASTRSQVCSLTCETE